MDKYFMGCWLLVAGCWLLVRVRVGLWIDRPRSPGSLPKPNVHPTACASLIISNNYLHAITPIQKPLAIFMEHTNDKSKEASLVFNKYAHEYQEKFMDVSLYKSELKTFCNLIKNDNAKVLDIACGPGNITKYLLSERPNLIVLGIDLATDMIALAESNNPSAGFKVMDCRSISDLAEKFDAVACAFCLPYLSMEEARKLLHDINALLSDQGVCYISTMEDDYNRSGYETGSKGDQVFIHYYEGDNLINMLTSCNFNIEEISRVRSTMGNGKEVTDLIIVARKQNGL